MNVLIDCTASEEVPLYYTNIFKIHKFFYISANKKGFASDIEAYNILFYGTEFIGYESTVGAGLPVIKTLKNLVES